VSEIVVGSMVVLKSHPSVSMTVCFIDTTVGTAVCYWLDENQEPMTETFPLVLLRPQIRRHPFTTGFSSRPSTTEQNA
jgi:membrane protein YqaA with SNARE-associated domain